MTKTVVVRIVRSDGQEMTLGTGTPWRIPNDGLEGFADLDYSIETSANVLTDGSSLVSKRVSERDRTISADYWGDDPDTARAQAMAFFNPKHSYECHVTYRGVTRWCEGEQYGFKCEPNNAYDGMIQITWTLLCLDPYMRGEDDHASAFGDSTPAFGFPFVSVAPTIVPGAKKVPVGFPCSVLVYDGKNSVYNVGDVPTMYRVVIRADGKLVNPTIAKDGKFVKLVTTLNDGDEAVIDFEAAPPKVIVNGTNAIQKCSRDSNFTGMEMQTGANVFTFTIDNAENKSLARVSVEYNAKYLGI